MSECFDSCPFCGAELKENATFCPSCGSDSDTGWSETRYMDGIATGGEYEENLENEFGKKEHPIGALKIFVIILIAVTILLSFRIF
jgi:uncharacterized membrane protein YvbJ